MRLECVVTCVNYADFLAHTLPWNSRQFDHLVVVTTPEDLDTQRLCETWDTHCVTTAAFHDGGSFNKGKGINAGLAALSLADWVVHMDADIALPATFSHHVRALKLTPSWIYGMDRVNCRSWEDWQRFVTYGLPQHEKDHLLHIGLFPPGARLVRRPYGGYAPIGYFQLWNPHASGAFAYSEDHGNAARGDVEFAIRWPREKRCLIPEVVAYHLESEPAAKGANWSGRTTVLFGLARDPKASHESTSLPLTEPFLTHPATAATLAISSRPAFMRASENWNGSNSVTHEAVDKDLYPGPTPLPWWRQLWNWIREFWDWEIW